MMSVLGFAYGSDPTQTGPWPVTRWVACTLVFLLACWHFGCTLVNLVGTRQQKIKNKKTNSFVGT